MPLPSGLCLVTGATGFVGAAVTGILLRAGHRVRVLARPESDRRNLTGLAVEVVQGSLEDATSLAAAVAGCRYLFHVAADYRLWVPDPAAMFRVNVGGTRELMLAALDHGRRHLIVGIGGSATNDGGAGMAQALGASLSDAAGAEIARGGAALARLAHISVSSMDARLWYWDGHAGWSDCTNDECSHGFSEDRVDLWCYLWGLF